MYHEKVRSIRERGQGDPGLKMKATSRADMIFYDGEGAQVFLKKDSAVEWNSHGASYGSGREALIKVTSSLDFKQRLIAMSYHRFVDIFRVVRYTAEVNIKVTDGDTTHSFDLMFTSASDADQLSSLLDLGKIKGSKNIEHSVKDVTIFDPDPVEEDEAIIDTDIIAMEDLSASVESDKDS